MAELSFEELQRHIDQISFGYKIVSVENSTGQKTPLLIKHPPPYHHMMAENVYSQTLLQAEVEGLPSQVEMEEVIGSRGLYGQPDIDEMETIKKQIKAQKMVLSKTTRVPARRDRLKQVIKELEEQATKIILKKEKYLDQTRERKALEQKLLYLTWQATYNVYTEEKYWLTFDKFLDEQDFLFRKRVYVEYSVSYYGLSQEIIRFIARSNLWRSRYLGAAKTGDSLFGKPIAEYSIDQLSIMYWSQYYSSIYEMMSDERPAEGVIEDDEALDAYMNDWYEERNRDNMASQGRKKSYGTPSGWDHQETIVTKANPMFQDVEYSETLAEKAKNKGKTVVDAAPMSRKK
jgi:hypothetical protein